MVPDCKPNKCKSEHVYTSHLVLVVHIPISYSMKILIFDAAQISGQHWAVTSGGQRVPAGETSERQLSRR